MLLVNVDVLLLLSNGDDDRDDDRWCKIKFFIKEAEKKCADAI